VGKRRLGYDIFFEGCGEHAHYVSLRETTFEKKSECFFSNVSIGFLPRAGNNECSQTTKSGSIKVFHDPTHVQILT
jgi:hypothetical protein